MHGECWAGQARLLAVHDRQLMAVSESLAWERAGGFPEAFVAAHDARVTQSGVRTGDRVLIAGVRTAAAARSSPRFAIPTIGTPSLNLGAFKAIDPIGSAFAECAGRIAGTVPAQVSLLGQRRATVSASNSRSRPRGSGTRATL